MLDGDERCPFRLRRWVEAGLLLLIVSVGLALRLPHLSLVPRFTDESLEVLWSLPIARGESLPATNFDAYYGSLFNLLVAASFWLAGPSALAARLVVLVAALLTIVATWALARSWRGPVAGLLAASLLAFNAAHILINSHVAWSNCITPFFVTLAVWLLWVGAREGSTRRWCLPLAGFAFGLALQTHILVATLLPGAALWVLLYRRELLRTPWPYLAVGAFLLGYGNLIVHNVQTGFESIATAQKLRREYAADQDAADGYLSALMSELLLLARVLGSAVDPRSGPIAFVLDPLVLLGSALAVVGLVWSGRSGNWLPLFLVLSMLILLPAVNPKFRALVTSRYVMPIVPLLLAVGSSFLVGFLRSGGARPFFGASAVLLLVGALSFGALLPLGRYYDSVFAVDDTNERAYQMSESIARNRHSGEAVLLDESYGSEGGAGVSERRALRYLLDLRDVESRVLKLTPRRLEDELGNSPSILVVLSGRQLREYDRLSLEPLTALPERGSETAIFRLRGARS